METWILILTMHVKMMNAGVGGIAVAEFNTHQACVISGKKWKTQTIQRSSRIDSDEIGWLCVKK